MKSKDFEHIFNKNTNKKNGINESNKKGAIINNNRIQQRNYTVTQNKGGRGK